jgi:ABC-type Zn uptake system ZnuABC Zn-binding protein ZnuA
VSADVDAERHEEKAAEAVVDASGDVQIMDEPDGVDDGDDDDDDDGHSMAEDIAAAAAVVEAEASELLAAAEAKAAEFTEEAAAVAKEVKKEGVAFMKSAKDKITTLVDKTKEITPAQMKTVAAGALGVWGVAAGVGWAMNHFSGSDADV